jgi:hypothetical protein
MKRITRIFKDLMTPDDQSQSWYAWATNQMSHAFLGALIAVFTGGYWLVATLIVAVIKEILDLSKSFRSKALSDSLSDILFWVCGAGIVAGGEYGYWFAFVLFIMLVIGIRSRVKKKT